MSEARERVVLDVTSNEKDIDKLFKAAVEGCVTTLSALLRKDPLILNEVSLTSFNETPLHIASSLGHLAFARALLENNNSLALEVDLFARSPLHLASAVGHTAMVELLLQAAPESCLLADRDGRIPLHLAAIRGRVQVILRLSCARPELSLVTVNGDNIAHLSVKYCHLEVVMMLLEDGLDDLFLYTKDGNGNTVLHLAVMLNHLKIVEYLGSLPRVKEYAFANALNHHGCTALDVFDLSQTKDLNSFRIHKVLVEIGVCRAKHENISSVDDLRLLQTHTPFSFIKIENYIPYILFILSIYFVFDLLHLW